MVTRLATCACGLLKVRCTGDPMKVSLCHCLDCQRRTGSMYGVAAFFRREDVEPQGATRSYTRQSDSGHPVTFNFCPECGSAVFWTPHRKPESVAVAVGAFADPAFPAPTQVVYSERGHPWVASPAVAAGPQLKTAIPILRIFSVEKAKEFYVDFLGFAVDWEHRFGQNFPLYAQISRSGLKLHLSEHHGDACPGATVFIWMKGIADYHGELTAKDYRYCRPGLEEAPWDAWVMEVGDPFGNRLRFSEPFVSDDPRA